MNVFQKFLPMIALATASQFVSAGSVSTSCDSGTLTINLGVNEGESCSVTQTVVVNGVSTTEVYAISSNTEKLFSLLSGDQATATVQMSCTSASGNSTSSGSASTDDGCQGSPVAFDDGVYSFENSFEMPKIY